MAVVTPIRACRLRSARLWRDEEGAGTVFGLFGILICLLFAGLSIDATNAWRNGEILGLSADVAAHAGVSRLAVTGDRATTLAAAMRAIELNTPAAVYGRTIYDALENIQVLHYDPETNLVSPGGELNAVSVRLERNARVQNPVPTFLLQLIGRQSWDISSTSVAAVVPTERCDSGNGIFARGEATLEGQAVVGADVCIHSQAGVGLAGRSSLESGSGLSMPDLSDCRGGCSEISSPGFDAAATEMNLVTTPPADHIDRLAAGFSNPDKTLAEEDAFFGAHPLADDLSALDELSVETAGLERGDVVELTTLQFDRARELPAGLVYHISCQSSGAGGASVLTIGARKDAMPAVAAAADVAGSSQGDGMSDTGDGFDIADSGDGSDMGDTGDGTGMSNGSDMGDTGDGTGMGDGAAADELPGPEAGLALKDIVLITDCALHFTENARVQGSLLISTRSAEGLAVIADEGASAGDPQQLCTPEMETGIMAKGAMQASTSFTASNAAFLMGGDILVGAAPGGEPALHKGMSLHGGGTVRLQGEHLFEACPSTLSTFLPKLNIIKFVLPTDPLRTAG